MPSLPVHKMERGGSWRVTATDTAVQEGIANIVGSTGLSPHSARILILYSGLTYTMTKLDQFPILVIKGPTETGKSTSMAIASELCSNVQEFIAQPTKAVLRDSLKENTTVFIEEADHIDEGLLTSRYSKDSPLPVNRPMGNNTFMRQSLQLFGATIMHRRLPFVDPATESRALTIYTVPKATSEVSRYIRGSILELRPFLQESANAFPIHSIPTLPAGRAEYNWGLLRLFNLQFPSDPSWTEYIDLQISTQQETTLRGREEEPAAKVWSAIVQIAFEYYEGFDLPKVVKHRFLLKDVVRAVAEGGVMYDSWQIGQVVRQIGFEVKNARGRQWIYPHSLEHIKEIGRNLHIDDELLND